MGTGLSFAVVLTALSLCSISIHHFIAQTGPPTGPHQPLYLHTRCLAYPVELVPMWRAWTELAPAQVLPYTCVAVGLTVADMNFTTDDGQVLLKSVFAYKTAPELV